MRELIASALDPVIAAAIERGKTLEERRANLLALRVCDPACGSGHFLLATARRLGRELARLTQGETEPDPAATRTAIREVIARCIYGVDHNPLAVDLCKLALWLEGHDAGRPLSFLEAHIKWGNSLVGATEELMAGGVPDAAFEPVTGDDKKLASAIKRDNKKERTGQYPLGWSVTVFQDEAALRRYFADLAGTDDSTATTRRKKQALLAHEATLIERRARLRADLWTAAFFWPLRADAPPPPTHGTWLKLLADDRLIDAAFNEAGVRDVPLDRVAPDLLTLRYARTLAREVAFFHWELEFEDIFARPDPGFDCILGNPPWERVKLQEQEFFAARDPEIAKAPNAAARGRAIAALREANPALHAAFEGAKATSENESHFLRKSERFPLTGRGDVNTYSVFAEQMARGLGMRGRAGIIVPTGIATDDTNKAFFGWLVNSGRLATLYDFENREGIFPGVHRSYKFAMLTAAGADRPAAPFEVAFFLTQPDQLRDEGRRFTLSAADIALFNPNTRTCPIFRSAREATITRKLYRSAPVLLREGTPDGNPWGISFLRMFDMTNDAALFRTREQLERDGWVLKGSVFHKEDRRWYPVIEGKMIGMYDHRAASIELRADNMLRQQQPVLSPDGAHTDPNFVTVPYLWAPEEVGRLRTPATWKQRWFPVFKRVTASTNERTMVGCVLPWTTVSYTLYTVVCNIENKELLICLTANMFSFVGDYVVRQKTGQPSLPMGAVYEAVFLSPPAYSPELVSLIITRVLELVYTAHDLAPFARDCGYDGPPFVWDEERRAGLRADLDGIYAHLYGLDRDDFAYILDTFPIVRQKDEKRWGEYRTKRLCLEAYDRFASLAAVGWVTEAPTPNVVSIPMIGAVAAAAPAAQPPSTPALAPTAPAADVVLAAPALPGLASPKATGADRYWQAAVLSWVAARGKGDFHFGRLKLVKELYFVQEHLGVDLRLDFVRETHGPLDPAVYKVEGLARTKGWLQVYGKRDERANYAAGRQAGEAANLARQRLGHDLVRVERLLDFFRPFDSQRIEQWATIHQVWRDRRARGEGAAPDTLVADVRAWKPDKRGFDDATIRREIDAMAHEGMIALDV